MKGFIIFEDYKKFINCKEILDGYYNCVISDCPNGTFSGVINRVTGATCNKDDTYDFETGALISLMKMCGVDKVVRACNEAFSEDTFKTYAIKFERELNDLSKKYDEVVKYCDTLRESNKRLQEEKENKKLKKNIDELFESEQHSKSELGRLYFEKHRLEEENEKLKLDCEKLCHGYNADMVICGSRQNGKQYKALVDLFKKTDQKKVDAAYKEAYNTTLPVWQKEFLKQMYEIRKIEASKYSLPHVHEWFYRIPTKRDEMWEKILGASKCPPVEIKVAKQDITSFLRELQDKIPEVRWNGSNCPPTENILSEWFKHDYIYFALFRFDVIEKLRICYDEKPHSWINKPVIEYIAPMRWDLFKKGRIAVRLTKDNYKEFYDICEKELGRSPSYKPDEFAYVPMEKYILKYNKKFKGYTFLGSTESEKIINWEDAR